MILRMTKAVIAFLSKSLYKKGSDTALNMEKTREQIVEDLIDHAKILGKGDTEDWQFIENIILMGSALLEIDETDSGNN